MIRHPFPPLYDENSKILILGSFPSVKSREQLFFYGHPQNRFWKVTSAVFGVKTPNTIQEKKDFQGIDRLVDVMSGEEFALIVLADPLTMKECEDIESSLYAIHNKLSPLSKLSVQESNGESETKGDSISKSDTDTNEASDSESNQTSKSTTKSTSEETRSGKGETSSGSETSTKIIDHIKRESKSKGTTTERNNSMTTNSGLSRSR